MSSVTTIITNAVSIASFNRGPVMTKFIPPTTCLSVLTAAPAQMYFGHQGGAYFDSACYPSATTPLGLDAWFLYYYSPAQCPTGWTEAHRVTSTFGKERVFVTVGPSTTAVVCCPLGYMYAGLDHACSSTMVSTTTTIPYIFPTLNNNVWWLTDANDPITTAITANDDVGRPPVVFLGDGIPVWWQSSDLQAFTDGTVTTSKSTNTIESTSKLTGSPRIGTEPSLSSNTSTPSNTNSKKGTLSTGAIIGLALGIPLAIVIVLLVASFVYIRNHTRVLPDTVSDGHQPHGVPHGDGKSELEYNSGPGIMTAHEIYSEQDRSYIARHQELASP